MTEKSVLIRVPEGIRENPRAIFIPKDAIMRLYIVTRHASRYLNLTGCTQAISLSPLANGFSLALSDMILALRNNSSPVVR